MKSWQQEQQAFWDWITRPQDLRSDEEPISALFAPHRALSQVEALGIYNNAYHQRLIQISAELYPVTHNTLGEDVYTRLWLDYLAEHPPRPGPMGLIGEALPAFTRSHPQFGQLPALCDIIALETLLIELFDRADEPAMTRAQLQALAPEQWPAHYFVARGDWAVISSQFDLEDYWSKMQAYLKTESAVPGGADFSVQRHAGSQTVHYLIRRVNYRMQFQRIDDTLTVFLSAVQARLNFAEICEQLAQRFPDQQIPVLSLQLLLRSIDLGLIGEPSAGKDPSAHQEPSADKEPSAG